MFVTIQEVEHCYSLQLCNACSHNWLWDAIITNLSYTRKICISTLSQSCKNPDTLWFTCLSLLMYHNTGKTDFITFLLLLKISNLLWPFETGIFRFSARLVWQVYKYNWLVRKKAITCCYMDQWVCRTHRFFNRLTLSTVSKFVCSPSVSPYC